MNYYFELLPPELYPLIFNHLNNIEINKVHRIIKFDYENLFKGTHPVVYNKLKKLQDFDEYLVFPWEVIYNDFKILSLCHSNVEDYIKLFIDVHHNEEHHQIGEKYLEAKDMMSSITPNLLNAFTIMTRYPIFYGEYLEQDYFLNTNNKFTLINGIEILDEIHEDLVIDNEKVLLQLYDILHGIPLKEELTIDDDMIHHFVSNIGPFPTIIFLYILSMGKNKVKFSKGSFTWNFDNFYSSNVMNDLIIDDEDANNAHYGDNKLFYNYIINKMGENFKNNNLIKIT